jgi:hypothetical protein
MAARSERRQSDDRILTRILTGLEKRRNGLSGIGKSTSKRAVSPRFIGLTDTKVLPSMCETCFDPLTPVVTVRYRQGYQALPGQKRQYDSSKPGKKQAFTACDKLIPTLHKPGR